MGRSQLAAGATYRIHRPGRHAPHSRRDLQTPCLCDQDLPSRADPASGSILRAPIHFSAARSNPVPHRRHRWPGLQELASAPTRPFADQRGTEKSMGARISFGTDFTRATSVPCRTTLSPPTPPRGGFAAYDIQRTSLTLRASSLSGQFQDIGFPALHMQPSGNLTISPRASAAVTSRAARSARTSRSKDIWTASSAMSRSGIPQTVCDIRRIPESYPVNDLRAASGAAEHGEARGLSGWAVRSGRAVGGT